eukprot:3321103-Pleurochrysis_carterae.AAC.1
MEIETPGRRLGSSPMLAHVVVSSIMAIKLVRGNVSPAPVQTASLTLYSKRSTLSAKEVYRPACCARLSSSWSANDRRRRKRACSAPAIMSRRARRRAPAAISNDYL